VLRYGKAIPLRAGLVREVGDDPWKCIKHFTLLPTPWKGLASKLLCHK
jgi:hypothetical protein